MNPEGTQESEAQVPQGLTEEHFIQLSQAVRTTASHLGEDIRVHGSRASFTARPDSDLDLAIRVSEERFMEILNSPDTSRLSRPNRGSNLMETREHSIATGKIQAGEVRLSALRRLLARIIGMEVDISVIKIGGPTDNGPWIPLR